MPKVIAIQSNLQHIGKELEARGYEVVHDSYEGYVDAILYHSDSSNLAYLNNFDNIIDMDKGAMIINAKDKSIDEIMYSLERRVYDSIF